MMDIMEKTVIRAEDVIWRRIEDEIVLIKDNGKETHLLNKTAAFIWELCDGENDVDTITAQLHAHFEVSLETAHNDTIKLIDKLLQLHVLIAAEEKVADER